MDPLAAIYQAQVATPVATPAIPQAWIESGAVTPVVVSPAATTATAWVPQPSTAAIGAVTTTGGSLLDAIADAMLGGATATVPPTPAEASGAAVGDAVLAQQLAQQQALSREQQAAAAQQQAQLASQQAVASQQQQLAMQAVPAPAAATAVLPAPAAAAVAAPPSDPTLIASVSGALAGFASATGRVVSGARDVAGAGVSKARKVGTELWAGVRNPRSIHVSQVPSKYNSAPAAGNRDCGPASVVMTLRLLGKSIPGAAGAAPQRMIDRVRQLSGNTANGASTTNHELERALTAAGTTTREIADAASIKRAVLAGKPVILNGNPHASGAYGPTFSKAQMTPYDGAHWIVVSGFDSKAGKYIVNDPLSKVGPVKVTPAQLEAYRGGSLGIEVAG